MAKTGPKRNQNIRFSASINVEICILAGGASKRMGRDKSRLRLGRSTMLGHIRKAARATGLPVRIIRRDCIPKCGPLSGIYTALKTTKSDTILFLACDMPLVSTELMRLILERVGESFPRKVLESRLQAIRSSRLGPLFVRSRGSAGFPFILPREAIEAVDCQIQTGDYSLQSLADSLRATILPLTHPWSQQLFNINTQKDWAAAHAKLSAELSRDLPPTE